MGGYRVKFNLTFQANCEKLKNLMSVDPCVIV